MPGVHLPQVDVIGAQPGQGSVQGRQHAATRRTAGERAVAGPRAGLRGEDEFGAGGPAQQAADQPLRIAARVHVGRVDQGSAGIAKQPQLVLRHVLVAVAAPPHGAERQSRHEQAACAHAAVFHKNGPYGEQAVAVTRSTCHGRTQRSPCQRRERDL